MKKILVPTLIASAIASLASVPALAQAQESTLSYNVGVVSDYRYRGISQSRLQPALQGGIDYADKSGFYVGAWGSTIQWIKDAGTLTDTAGVKGYEYVNNKLANTLVYGNANTNEVYGALTYGVFTAKYSHALSNLFGNLDSKNSYYVDLSATFDLGEGYSLAPHVGYQKVKGAANVDASYTDYALTLAKDLGNGLSATAALVDTNASKTFYTTPNGKFPGRTGAVVGLKYAF